MIIERKGDLLKAKVGIIAHQTNCHGKMGAGVAKQIKDKLLSEEEFDIYKGACDCLGSSLLGHIQTLKAKDGRLVVNVFGEDFPTGKGLDTDYKALYSGLSHLEEKASSENLSVAIPGLMGCGLAGGDWNYVKNNIIAPIFEASSVRLEIVYFLEEDFAKYATFTEPTAVMKIIQGLDFTIDMFLLNPNTGEIKSKELLNDMDRTTVDACEEAMKILSTNVSQETVTQLINLREHCKEFNDGEDIWEKDVKALDEAINLMQKFL